MIEKLKLDDIRGQYGDTKQAAILTKINELVEAVNRLEKRTICSCDDCMIQRQQNSA